MGYSDWCGYAEGLGPRFVAEFEGRQGSKEVECLAYMGVFLIDVELTSATDLILQSCTKSAKNPDKTRSCMVNSRIDIVLPLCGLTRTPRYVLPFNSVNRASSLT